MKDLLKFSLALILGMAITASGCNKDDEDDNTSSNNNNNGGTTELPEVYEKIKNVTDVYLDGEFVVIETEGIPDHKSPYYENTIWEADRYEGYMGTNPDYHRNPNRITAQNMTFRIPLNPAKDDSHQATGLGAIGVTVNGVAIFNQYAAPGDDLSQEINTFDHYNGHPQQMGMYHYHIEPTYLTETNGGESLIGFLLDGFPVYGPMESGQTITNADLDQYHGHQHVTADYPDGIYHYHVTDTDPYINGDGYYGTPGTVSN